VAAVDGAVDSNITVYDCDSKKMPNNALFPCPVRCGVGDELVVVEAAGSCEMTSLGLGGPE